MSEVPYLDCCKAIALWSNYRLWLKLTQQHFRLKMHRFLEPTIAFTLLVATLATEINLPVPIISSLVDQAETSTKHTDTTRYLSRSALLRWHQRHMWSLKLLTALAAALTVAFLVMQCFKAITANEEATGNGGVSRRLATSGKSCFVSRQAAAKETGSPSMRDSHFDNFDVRDYHVKVVF